MQAQKNTESPYDILINKLLDWKESFFFYLPNIIVALIIFILSFWISRKLANWSKKLLKKHVRQASVRDLISNVISIIFTTLGLLLALSILNLDGTLKSLLAGAGVAGLAISLALQGTLANTFSGIFIAIKDELNVGDWINTNGYSGKVQEINLRNTKIKEADNNIVVLPNKLILDKPFKNYGLTKRIRTTITCGIDYRSDLERVKNIAKDAIQEIYPPSTGEKIEFYYENFNESSIDFILRFWVDAQENLTALQVKSNAIIQLKKAFDKHNINIPFPIRTLINEDKI